MTTTRVVKVLTCHQCKYEWIPREGRRPKRCPNPKCQSPNWDQAKGKKK